MVSRKYKRAVSSVIASVLLILITIAATSVLAFIIIPFVRNSLNEGTNCFQVIDKIEKGTNCFQVIDKIEIINEASCYTLSPETSKVKVKAGNINLEGIYLVIEKDGDEVSYEITNNSIVNDINNREALKLPTSGGGERTYNFNFRSSKAGVGIIVNEKRCGISDETTLNIC
ncbi:hypothetical protein J4205_01155 [Candidatus Pacearchaeota archaeon]|nr:hypothetical protein [Candidatus Pacearchaeota archaeon]